MKRTITLLTTLTLMLSIVTVNLLYFPAPKYIKVIAKSMPAVVDISVIVDMENPFTGQVGKAKIEGSGCYISPKGFILTCGHLFNFKKIYSINITNAKGETVAGKLLKVNFKRDLALVRTTFYKETPYVLLEDPRDTKVGEEVFAIGSPAGFTFSVTNGIVSALNRDIDTMYNTLQTNTAINPGNSGGPLINLKGELVGVVSFFVPVMPFIPINSGLGFCVSPGQCLEFLVRCGKDIPEIRSYRWFTILLSSLGSKSLEP